MFAKILRPLPIILLPVLMIVCAVALACGAGEVVMPEQPAAPAPAAPAPAPAQQAPYRSVPAQPAPALTAAPAPAQAMPAQARPAQPAPAAPAPISPAPTVAPAPAAEAMVVEVEKVVEKEVVKEVEAQASAPPMPAARPAPAAPAAPQAAPQGGPPQPQSQSGWGQRGSRGQQGSQPGATTFRDYERSLPTRTSLDSVSTFSLDTDRTSFQLALNWARAGYDVEPDSVRSEEWVNAFDYGYEQPRRDDSFAIHTDVMPHPLVRRPDTGADRLPGARTTGRWQAAQRDAGTGFVRLDERRQQGGDSARPPRTAFAEACATMIAFRSSTSAAMWFMTSPWRTTSRVRGRSGTP